MKYIKIKLKIKYTWLKNKKGTKPYVSRYTGSKFLFINTFWEGKLYENLDKKYWAEAPNSNHLLTLALNAHPIFFFLLLLSFGFRQAILFWGYLEALTLKHITRTAFQMGLYKFISMKWGLAKYIAITEITVLNSTRTVQS